LARPKSLSEALDKIFNHTAGKIDGVAAVRNRRQLLDERRDAPKG